MSGIIVKAIRVAQPLGEFFAFNLSAEILNRITYSLPAQVRKKLDSEVGGDGVGGYGIFGAQRREDEKRLDEIAKYIMSSDVTFPNAIILAANYDDAGNFVEDESRRWSATESNGSWSVHIPDLDSPTASIIDGQHRLHAFRHLPTDSERRQMELLCVVFIDLPVPYHAYVFATINFNQKKVDRSLAFELFGFDLEERSAKFWAPETLGVYIARLLNTEPTSPLFRCIAPAADARALFEGAIPNQLAANSPSRSGGVREVKVSMATVVDGVVRLISRKPMEDRYFMRRPENEAKGRRALPTIPDLPVRTTYLDGNDRAIYELVANYFHAVSKTIWSRALPGSYLRKTVGIQALFDVLLYLSKRLRLDGQHFSVDALTKLLAPAAELDPDGTKYQASGIGRAQIRRDILGAIGGGEA
ncbi:MAG: DGQHR domain-containing protein [Dehalococcoidia bacterium]